MIHAPGTGDWFTRCHSNSYRDHHGIHVMEVDDGKEKWGVVSRYWEKVTCPRCREKMPKRIKRSLVGAQADKEGKR